MTGKFIVGASPTTLHCLPSVPEILARMLPLPRYIVIEEHGSLREQLLDK